MLEIAIRTAVGRRGVGVVVIPGDVALLKAEHDGVMADTRGLLPVPPVVQPTGCGTGRARRAAERTKRVTLLCGRGCAGAHDELMQLAEALKAPIVHALGGKETSSRTIPSTSA